MNLIEATKTGKPIKRAFWCDYLTIQACNCDTSDKGPHQECPQPSLAFPGYVEPRLTAEDIQAEDWVFLSTDENK